MIRFLLQEIEKSPSPAFSKRQLLDVSPDGFQDLLKRKILHYWNPPEGSAERLRSPRCQQGCSLTVEERDGRLEAFCLNHPEEDPIVVTKDDLPRYRVSIDKLLLDVRRANELDGDFHRINGGDFYLGYRAFSQGRIGFVFVQSVGQDERMKVSSLRHLCEDDDILVVLSPATEITEGRLKRELRQDRVVLSTLVESMNPDTLELPLAELVSQFVDLEQAMFLSSQQRIDYETHGYLCYDKLHILGDVPHGRGNVILLNGVELTIGDSLFALLLRFVVELKKGADGWVNVGDLHSGGLISDPARYQAYSNLRKTIEGSLLEKDGKEFIESDGSKNYRVSTHPDFIACDKSKLAKHPDGCIGELAKQLP